MAGFTQIMEYYLQGEVDVTPPTAEGGYVVSFDPNGFSMTKATGERVNGRRQHTSSRTSSEGCRPVTSAPLTKS